MDINKEKILKLIQENGWTRCYFASQINISPTLLCRVFNGKRKPGMKFLRGFLEFCNREGIDPSPYVNMNLLLPNVNGKRDHLY